MIVPETPALPLLPTPVCQETDLPDPIVHSGENALSELVNPAVVPDPSDRNTTVILPS